MDEHKWDEHTWIQTCGGNLHTFFRCACGARMIHNHLPKGYVRRLPDIEILDPEPYYKSTAALAHEICNQLIQNLRYNVSKSRAEKA